MSSHSYEQPTSYGRPLGHSPKCHWVYKCTSYEQTPVLKGHIACVARVAAHRRFYCICHIIAESLLLMFGLSVCPSTCICPPLSGLWPVSRYWNREWDQTSYTMYNQALIYFPFDLALKFIWLVSLIAEMDANRMKKRSHWISFYLWYQNLKNIEIT